MYGHTSHDMSSYLLEASYSDEEDIEVDLFARDNSSFEEIEEEVQREGPDTHPEGSSSQNSDLKSRNADAVDLGDREVLSPYPLLCLSVL